MESTIILEIVLEVVMLSEVGMVLTLIKINPLNSLNYLNANVLKVSTPSPSPSFAKVRFGRHPLSPSANVICESPLSEYLRLEVFIIITK